MGTLATLLRVGDGTQKNTTGGAAAQLQARADGTVNGRRVTLLKFPVSSLTPNALQRVLLSLTASAITQNANVQAHVYGVNNASWTESAATWATFTPTLRQNVAAGNKIANNIVANPFTTTQMLGQMVVTSAADSEKLVDVTEFVRGQTDGFASFMIVQDHRWDTAIPSLTAGDTQSDGIKIVAKEAGTVSAPGPRLRVISNQTGNTAPTIITHPANQSVTVGSSASFSVVAGGTSPLTYQWRKDGTPINGATSAGYTLTATVAGDAGSYSVVVTNAQGSATSNGATLTVNPVPALPAEDDVIINEFVVNPVSGKEYVELLVVYHWNPARKLVIFITVFHASTK